MLKMKYLKYIVKRLNMWQLEQIFDTHMAKYDNVALDLTDTFVNVKH